MSEAGREATPARPGARRAGQRAAEQRRTAERLVALLILGCVVLDFPLLSVLRGRGLVAGVPVLFVYLFLVWAMLAGLTALVLRRRPTRPESPEDDPGQREP